MMRRLLLCMCVSFSLGIFSQNVELSNELADYFYKKQNAVSLKSTSVSHHDHLWMTPLLKRVVNNWEDLTETTQAIFKPYLVLSEIKGTQLTYVRGDVMFHYTIDADDEGQDVDSTDTNNSGVPDYVENMADVFDVCEAAYHDSLHLAGPILSTDFLSADQSGDLYYHVYISGAQAGNGIYGYVASDSQWIVGDNSSTTAVEYDAAISYMVLRNNYEGFGDEDGAVKVTIAHEYLHTIQYATDFDMEAWFCEATAAYGEEYVYPGVDDNLQYIDDILETPDVALNFGVDEGSEFHGHWYGSFLFFQYLVEKTSTSIIKQMYDVMTVDKDYVGVISSIDSVLKTEWSDAFASYDELHTAFAITSTLLACDYTYVPYNYIRGSDYIAYEEDFYLEATFDYSGETIDFASETDGNDRLMRLSYDPFLLTSDQNFSLTFTCDNAEVVLALMRMTSSDYQLDMVEANGVIDVTDNLNWESYSLAVVRKDMSVSNTLSQNYNITIGQSVPSFEEEIVFSDLVLSPNPVSDCLTVSGSVSYKSIEVLDVSGKVMLVQTGVDRSINVSALKEGCYFVKVTQDNGMSQVQKFVVVR